MPERVAAQASLMSGCFGPQVSCKVPKSKKLERSLVEKQYSRVLAEFIYYLYYIYCYSNNSRIMLIMLTIMIVLILTLVEALLTSMEL